MATPLFIRTRYLGLGAATVFAGLIVYFYSAVLSSDARDIIGDALWAMMMACWVSAAVPRCRSWVRYLVAFAVCGAVELSQLWQLPALQYGRSTIVGRLVLGSGFDPRDFVAYAVGIVVFIALDQRWLKHHADIGE